MKNKTGKIQFILLIITSLMLLGLSVYQSREARVFRDLAFDVTVEGMPSETSNWELSLKILASNDTNKLIKMIGIELIKNSQVKLLYDSSYIWYKYYSDSALYHLIFAIFNFGVAFLSAYDLDKEEQKEKEVK